MANPEAQADPADATRVVDASAAARWLLDGNDEVGKLVLEEGNIAPSFIALELAHALVRQVRTSRMDPAGATAALNDLLSAGVTLVPVEALATSALSAALDLGLTAYDAAYVVLARTYGVALLTADRRLAAVYDQAILIE